MTSESSPASQQGRRPALVERLAPSRAQQEAEFREEHIAELIAILRRHIATPDDLREVERIYDIYHTQQESEYNRSIAAFNSSTPTIEQQQLGDTSSLGVRERMDMIHKRAIARANVVARDSVEDEIRSFIDNKAIVDDDEYDAMYDALRGMTELDEDIWNDTEVDSRGVQNSGFKSRLESIVGNQTTDIQDGAPENDDDDEEDDTPEQDVDLETARAAYLKAAAARLRAPAFGRKKRAKLTKRYEEAQELYIEKLLESQKQLIEQMEQERGADGNPRYSSDEIRAVLLRSISDRTTTDQTAIKDAMVDQGGWLARRLDSYANLSRKKKIAVGLGVAALGAGLGAGVGLLAGSLGVAAAATGTGFGALSRFGRTFALRYSRIYQNDQAQFTVADNTEADAVLQAAQNWIKDHTDKRIESADKTKRRAVYWALGSVAVGGAAAVIGEAAHAAGGAVDSLPDAHDAADVPSVEPEVPEVPEVVVDTPSPEVEFSQEALTIENGEGWYQTFKDMGIPREHWSALLNQSGPKLQEMGIAYHDPSIGGYGISHPGEMPEDALRYIHDVAAENHYIETPTVDAGVDIDAGSVSSTDAPIDGVSVSELPENTLDETDLNFLKEQAAAVSGAHESITAENVADLPENHVDTVSNVVDTYGDGSSIAQNLNIAASTIDNGEGWYQTMGELHIASDHWQQLLSEKGPELGNLQYPDGTKVAYFDTTYNQWRMNMSPDGRLHQGAIDLLLRANAAHNWVLAA